MPSERIQRRLDALLDQAEEALTRHDWETARARAQTALALDHANADAKHYAEAAGYGLANAAPSPARTEDTQQSGNTRFAVDQTHSSPNEGSSPPGELPSSFSNGRYEVKEFLGEGGKKKVYRAHDTTLDRDVAFALINTDGLDETSRQRVTREAQAMGRLGDHPNIVPIFDLGQEKDPVTGVTQPFMVLPLMTGGDVEGVIEKSPEHRLPLERVIQITKDTCEGLAFAHSKGIVHRDLKPGNVWLSENGRARIGDFGLAVATDRSRLTREGMMVGTVAYMPPEQAMGGEITPRADLYSLGAMLYEMVTGRPPFLGDDDIAVIGQHINTPPVAPTWHNPQCPKTLDSLIMRLLAKDPLQRPASASETLQVLRDIVIAKAPPASEAEPAQARTLDAMSSGVFVGRQKEMDQVKSALEDTLSGRGRMITLVGDPGIGKTRTSTELATYASLRNCQVLWGRCYEGTGAPPYWPWVQAIRAYARKKEPAELRREMGSTASVIAEIVAEVKDRLPDLQAPARLEDAESARFRLFDSIATFLKNASASQPLLLIIDDLHWADRPSLALLEFVVGELSASRIMLVGTYRDVELNRRHPLSATLGDLTRERLFERVLLRGLSKSDVDRFIELASGARPPRQLVDAVYRHTEGNPLFVTETVRLLVQEGELRADGAGDRARRDGSKSRGSFTWEIRIPEGVREVIGRRLDRLSERCNEVLATAAVIGRQFRFDVLLRLFNDPSVPADERLSEDRLLAVTDEALSARVIEELPAEVGLYQFTHALLQETLLEELSLTRRVRLHARIAEALEAAYGDQAVQHASELAYQFEQAQERLGTEKLVKYSMAAAEEALAAYAIDEASTYFLKAKDATKADQSSPPYAEALFGLARCVSAMAGGGIEATGQALDQLEKAFDVFIRSGLRERAATVAQTPIMLAGLGERAVELHRKGVPIAEPGSVTQGFVLARYGTALYAVGRFEESLSALENALEISLSHGDRQLEARVRTHLNQRLVWKGEFAAAVAEAPEVMRVVESNGDTTYVTRLASHLFMAAVALGQTAWATEVLKWWRKRVERNPYAASTAAFLGAQLAAATGEWEQCRREMQLAESFPVREGATEYLKAEVSWETGDPTPLLDLSSRLRDTVIRQGDCGLAKQYVMQCRVTGTNVPTEVTERLDRFRARMAGATVMLNGVLVVEALTGITNREDRELARSRYQSILRHEGDFDPTALVSKRRILGLLAEYLGDLNGADAHFSAAEEACERAGIRPELGWSLSDHAEMLLARNAPGDRERASTLDEKCLSLARELGMKPLTEQVLKRREILKA